MAEQMDLDQSPSPPPPPLEVPRHIKFGRFVSTRLLRNLRECQKDALGVLVCWFNSANTMNSTAVIVMSTGSGKSGVICSLSYWFGNAIETQQLHGIDVHKPILIITLGLNILGQLRDDLIQSSETNCFLMKMNALRNDGEVRNYLYRVKVTDSIRDVDTGLRFCQEEIVLTSVQKWRGQKVDRET